MDGHATSVLVHPSSCLFGHEEEMNWVLFHEVVSTSKAYMRTITPIDYSWVQDKLPKLHEVDVHMLSGSGEVASFEKSHRMTNEVVEVHPEVSAAPAMVERKTTDAEVEDARARYLARKQARAGRK
eukprot:m.161326 g.161326  ORF g.161326 m.161326 type:complete len:126 (+) comp10285_c0_seq1:3258-3635(+)